MTNRETIKAKKLTPKGLIDDTRLGKQVKKSYITIKSDDSLEVAKQLMERKTPTNVTCSDVFVTEDGKTNSQVLGWTINVLINENSTVD